MVRLQFVGFDQFIWFYQCDISCKGYQGVKVVGVKLIGQVVKCVVMMSVNQCQVGVQWVFEQSGFIVECQCLFVFFYDGVDICWGEKIIKFSFIIVNLFDQCILWYQNDVYFIRYYVLICFWVGVDM